MRKTLYKAFFSVIGAFLLLTCISCHPNSKDDLNVAKYDLIKYSYNNQEFKANEEYNYYYVIFDFQTNEVAIVFNKKSENIENTNCGSFVEGNNMYIANINGTTLNFVFLDNNRLECYMWYVKCIFKLDN